MTGLDLAVRSPQIVLTYYLFDSYRIFFIKGMRDGSLSSSMAKSLVLNESIKLDPIQIVFKDYLKSHRTEDRSV